MGHGHAGYIKERITVWGGNNKRGMNTQNWNGTLSCIWKEHQRRCLISGGSTLSSDVHPLCLSIPLHPSLSHDEMDDGDECAWGTERGREGGIIPSEYMMNVVIRLKLAGGASGTRGPRACMWVTPSTIVNSPLQPLSVSPSSSCRETQGIRQQTRQGKKKKRGDKKLLSYLYWF